ncbi:MAG: 23S rRNA (adenine(2503)-C(2))-methyltransferase RlmN [Eggerthellaceae bacterium]|nr:23S rRNA (adenine(2503)-C(2))-methyltransferase RlmN [Eggerthellaceae bacterium]
MTDLRNLSKSELVDVVEGLGEPKFRAKQLYEWFHKHNVSNYDQMTNLSKALRERLANEFPLEGAEQIKAEDSSDGTKKYLTQFSDGTVVETVGMPITQGENGEKIKRLTVCFSTQAGCPMACSFCATGHAGFNRNLTTNEMVDQVVAVRDDFGTHVSNVVAMGQGEPFLNYDNLMTALRRMNTDPGLNIGARKITVSTVGIIDGILKFAKEPEQFRLAVSLHSAKQKVRDKLIPGCKNQPLNDLQQALIQYNQESGRRVTLEYMLIDGVNDSDSDLEQLILFCDGINCHVNLIPYNEIMAAPYKPSSSATIKHWQQALAESLIPVSVRNSRGFDINGACGQLKEIMKL